MTCSMFIEFVHKLKIKIIWKAVEYVYLFKIPGQVVLMRPWAYLLNQDWRFSIQEAISTYQNYKCMAMERCLFLESHL
jgi:hypothetical protein